MSLFMQRLAGRMESWMHPGSEQSKLNARLRGYPRNHDYQVVGNRLIPSRKLELRFKRMAELYPETLTSLLDVGSCKGYFVLEAAGRGSCRSAVGIDVVEPFVNLAREVASHLKQVKATFYVSPLHAYQGQPAQVILLLNLYHYLFAGSALSDLSYKDHRPIFEKLASLCTDRVLFSGPMELGDCPTQVQDNARALGIGERFTAAKILEAAGEFFVAESRGVWGKRPLYVLKKR